MLDEPGGRVPASWELTIRVQAGERLSLEQIRAFLEASETVGFQGRNREEVYAFVYRTLRQQRYQELKRSGRGLVRRYVAKMTGLSRAQTIPTVPTTKPVEKWKSKSRIPTFPPARIPSL